MTEIFSPQDGPRPIERLYDIVPGGHNSLLERPAEAVAATELAVDRQLSGLAGASSETADALMEDAAYTLAWRERLVRSPLFGAEDSVARQVEAGEWAKLSFGMNKRYLHPSGRDMYDLVRRANALAPAEIAERHMQKLESYAEYLQTGARPENWPGAGELIDYESSDEVRRIAETMYISTRIPEIFNDERLASEVQARLADWAANMCSVLLHRRHIGLAVPYLNMLEGEAAAAGLAHLCEAMDEVGMAESEREYRKLYGGLVRSLAPQYIETFKALVPRREVPLTDGARRKTQEIGGHIILTEQYFRNEEYTVRLADGAPFVLPYRQGRERLILNYQEDDEHELEGYRTRVTLAELDDSARQAIMVALRAERANRLREETLPYYHRLVLTPGEGGVSDLHISHFAPDRPRRLHVYPDDHGFVTSETDKHVAHTVRAITPVSENWLIVPYRDGYADETTYLDPEPNFFGPGEDRANAFWISGGPLIVYDEQQSPQFMRLDERTGSRDKARWVIMPVTYYWIEKGSHPETD